MVTEWWSRGRRLREDPESLSPFRHFGDRDLEGQGVNPSISRNAKIGEPVGCYPLVTGLWSYESEVKVGAIGS
jgi:hypothetical protein